MKLEGAKVQVKHISDEVMLNLIRASIVMPYVIIRQGEIEVYNHNSAMLGNLYTMWPNVPPNLILAKLRNLEKKGLIDGCTCGCRGSFTVLEERVKMHEAHKAF